MLTLKYLIAPGTPFAISNVSSKTIFSYFFLLQDGRTHVGGENANVKQDISKFLFKSASYQQHEEFKLTATEHNEGNYRDNRTCMFDNMRLVGIREILWELMFFG